MMKILQPATWPMPRGYSNGILAEGKILSIAGQIGWSEDQKLVSHGFVEQVEQALKNIVTVLASGNARPDHVVRLIWYVTDKKEYLRYSKEIGAVYRAIFGSHYPAMTLVQVADLLEEGAKVEIEATAVIP